MKIAQARLLVERRRYRSCWCCSCYCCSFTDRLVVRLAIHERRKPSCGRDQRHGRCVSLVERRLDALSRLPPKHEKKIKNHRNEAIEVGVCKTRNNLNTAQQVHILESRMLPSKASNSHILADPFQVL